MNDYQLGTRLREQILRDQQRGISSDGRRLQALVGDLCADQQSSLVPAITYVLRSPAFSHAIAQQPPLPPDPRLQLRLQQELEPVFAQAICQRMQAVVCALLALPAPPAVPATASSTLVPAADPASEPAATTGGRGLVAVLSFIAGILVVGVGGGLTWLLMSRTTPPQGQPQLSSQIQADPAPAAVPQPASVPPAPDLDQAQLQQAISAVEQLYADLSSGNTAAARSRFSPAAADQFDPTFFSQFQRVSVSELHQVNREGQLLTLSGVVSFEYPDGSTQRESRNFTLDLATTPPLITASSFGQVLSPRP